MAKRRTKNAMAREHKRQAREQKMENPGGSSKFARKESYLKKHGGWGFEYTHKPWK